MKVMLSAFAAMAIIAVGSNAILGSVGFSAEKRTSGAAVRLD